MLYCNKKILLDIIWDDCRSGVRVGAHQLWGQWLDSRLLLSYVKLSLGKTLELEVGPGGSGQLYGSSTISVSVCV